MRRSTAKWIQLVIFLAEAALVLYISRKGPLTQGMYTLLIVSLGVYCIAALFFQYHMRCPKCGKWPTRGWLHAQYCPRCGEPLDQEKE